MTIITLCQTTNQESDDVDQMVVKLDGEDETVVEKEVKKAQKKISFAIKPCAIKNSKTKFFAIYFMISPCFFICNNNNKKNKEKKNVSVLCRNKLGSRINLSWCDLGKIELREPYS